MFGLDALLGDELLSKAKGPAKSTLELMEGKELVGLYFSASWCPPCKAFSPILADFYKAIATRGRLEIVYISSDKTVDEFEGYVSLFCGGSVSPLYESIVEGPLRGSLKRVLHQCSTKICLGWPFPS